MCVHEIVKELFKINSCVGQKSKAYRGTSMTLVTEDVYTIEKKAHVLH